MAIYSKAVSSNIAALEVYDKRNSPYHRVDVFHVFVNNMYPGSNAAFSQSTDLGHDYSKIGPRLLDIITGILTSTSS
jgi:hypothetical protein